MCRKGVRNGKTILSTSPGAGAPFLVDGTVFEAGAREPIGRFVRTGTQIAPRSDHQIIQDALVIDGRGLVFLAGFIPGAGRCAIIGATGEFVRARGEAVIEALANSEAFRVSFEIRVDDPGGPEAEANWWDSIRAYLREAISKLRGAAVFDGTHRPNGIEWRTPER